jgi:hypothetical protein
MVRLDPAAYSGKMLGKAGGGGVFCREMLIGHGLMAIVI